MGNAAVNPLKSGQNGEETAKQAEIRLAVKSKILRIGRSEARNGPTTGLLWLSGTYS
jgi:hypothetical protein